MRGPKSSMESFKETWFYMIFRRLIKGKLAVIGLAVFIGIIAISALAPWIVPYDPNAINTSALLKPPSAAYWMGTDELGRDVFSRIIYGTRISLVVGVIAVAMAMAFGAVLGLIAGYWRGAADHVIMSVTDSVWAFPTLILALAITAVLGPSLTNVTIAIGLVFTPGFARLVRSMVLSVREREYIQSAKSIGLNDWEIIVQVYMAEYYSDDDRSGVIERCTGDHCGGFDELSGPWDPATGSKLGIDAQSGLSLSRNGVLAEHIPGTRHSHHGSGAEFPG